MTQDKHWRRKDIRTDIIMTEIQGLASSGSENAKHIPFVVKNISDSGIGIWTAELLPQGATIKITIAKPKLLTFECEVRWCVPFGDTEERNGFEAGLMVKSDTKVLETLHSFINGDMNAFT